MMDATALARFEAKVMPEPMSGCWLWTGQISPKGYAYFGFDGRPHRAHRLSYEHFVGRIPDGLVIDHLCRVRDCVNPAHLEPVTIGENTRRGNAPLVRSSRTHCPRQHPFDAANTLYKTDGSRRCRTCHRDNERARWRRSKGLNG